MEEVAFLKECQHPALMRVYDDGDIHFGGRQALPFPFVIADYLPLTLYDGIRRGLTMIERLTFSLQLLSAAAFLNNHHRRVVHRDIKPENIFLRGKACILGDFGLLKFLEPVAADATPPDREFLIESVGPRLPRFYRTPDLVAYCKGEAELSTKSDVFQLGLVFSEMFTGQNPLRPPKDIYDDIALDSLTEVPGSQAAAIRSNLNQMLLIDPAMRPSAEELLDPWEGVFLEAVKVSHQLEGRIF